MRTPATALAAGLILLALGACALGEKPEAGAARNICAIAYGDPALDSVRGHIPFEDDTAAKASMDYLTDTTRPSQAERAALLQLDAANRRCWDAWDKAGTSPHIQAARAKVSAALGELYNGKTTYGDFNRARATAISEMRSAIAQSNDLRNSYGHGGSGVSLGLGLGYFRF
jgi:hypothetical protein